MHVLTTHCYVSLGLGVDGMAKMNVILLELMRDLNCALQAKSLQTEITHHSNVSHNTPTPVCVATKGHSPDGHIRVQYITRVESVS